jgi:D-aminopeptidase
MYRAIDRLAQMQPYRPPSPLRGELDLRLPVMADYAGILPGIERIGSRTLAFGADDGETFFRTFLALMRLSGTSSTS